MTTSSRFQSQCGLGHCGTEVERAIFGPLGPRTILQVGDLNVERPADFGGTFLVLDVSHIAHDRRRVKHRDYSPGGTATLRVE